MNIFVLDTDLTKCAQYHCDKHVVKMITEYAQLLSSACRISGIDTGYRLTHKNHPCTKWASESIDNWKWLRLLLNELHKEYKVRYGSHKEHKSAIVGLNLPEPNIPSKGLTPWAQAMPEEYRNLDVVKAYRDYYMGEKRHIAEWKTNIPKWYK